MCGGGGRGRDGRGRGAAAGPGPREAAAAARPPPFIRPHRRRQRSAPGLAMADPAVNAHLEGIISDFEGGQGGCGAVPIGEGGAEGWMSRGCRVTLKAK